MKLKILPTLIFLILLLVFLIFYKGLQNPNVYTPSVEIKKDIPIFQAKLFDTENVISSEEIFRDDEYYLMNIWASWCVPCRDEHVFLLNLSKVKNLEIIGINYKDTIDNAKNFLQEFKSPYKFIISDNDGILAIDWGAYGVPETFLVYDKKIIKKFIGPINQKSLLEIKKAIK